VKGAKNLAEVESRQEAAQRESTKPNFDSATIKGKIVEYAWWLKKEGYAESTIEMRTRNLRRLVKLGANLYDPESVKEVIANQSWCVNTKAIVTDAYNTFLGMLGLTWKAPRYKQETSFPFIPTEAEIDALIASCGKKTATFLQLLKETGMRPGEAIRLEWRDVDSERRLINLTKPEKRSNPRIFHVSTKLIDMLNQLPKNSEKVFGKSTLNGLRATLCTSRKRAARKLANPRLLQIHFHTLRHWKGTMEYHKTKDPWHVKQLLGHKSLKNTEVYINLEQAIFSQRDDSEYITRIAKTVKGARALLEAGFEYVTDMDGYKLFRKRK
jgi:integrase